VAYEPVEAIGTGKPDSPENAQSIARLIKEKNNEVEYVLYGGSVNGENVKGFTDMQDISGVLVGGASLDPHNFLGIIKAC
jgi:triosephosphate isomerase